jgi:hypothetical protein
MWFVGGVGEMCVATIRNAGASISAVVPAKAGTHNHREEFGEDYSLGIKTPRNR